MQKSRSRSNEQSTEKTIARLAEQQNCEYCKLKEKHRISGSPESTKCLMHHHLVEEVEQEEDAQGGERLVDQILRLLYLSEEGLREYCNQLGVQGWDVTATIAKELGSIAEVVGSMQVLLSKFTAGVSFQNGTKQKNADVKAVKGIKKSECKSLGLLTSQTDLDHMGIDETWLHYVKAWTTHFYNLLEGNTDTSSVLPCDNEIEAQMFKEEMDRKFLTLLSKYEQQQTKIDQIAEKMLFYMEKCGSAVEEQRIAEDITFLQRNAQQGRQHHKSLPKMDPNILSMLLLQANVIQRELDRRQLSC